MEPSKLKITPATKAGRCKRCLYEDNVVFNNKAGYYVVCFNCDARTAFYLSESQAIAAWNSGALLNRAQKRRLLFGSRHG